MGAHREEGWYTDPFGKHEARWISDGEPTNLVRDGRTEARDEPPDEKPSHPLVKIEAPNASGPEDAMRADAAEGGTGAGDLQRADDTEQFDGKKLEEAVWDVFPEFEQPPG